MEKSIKVMCFGNSILCHGPSEAIGWSGMWGMAASSEDKDYFHLLQKKTNDAGFENVEFKRGNLGPFERSIDNRTDCNYKSEIDEGIGMSVQSFKPDIAIFQMGENMKELASKDEYAKVLYQVFNTCKASNKNCKCIFCTPFWKSEIKEGGIRIITENEMDAAIVHLSELNVPENTAKGLFEHGGVAAHPGDKGMEAIASAIFVELKKILFEF